MNIKSYLQERAKRRADLKKAREVMDPEAYAAQEGAYLTWRDTVVIDRVDYASQKRENLQLKKQELRNNLQKQKISKEVYAKGMEQISKALKDLNQLKA